MADLNHPFQPGARVAIRSGSHSDEYREAVVEKAHKTGRFTLVGGGGEQWRPSKWGDGRWRASTTNAYSRSVALLWDETTDAEIRDGLAEQRRRDRWRAIRVRVDCLRQADVTDAMIDAIEAALPNHD